MATDVTARWIDPNGYGFGASSDDLQPNQPVELTFQLDDSDINRVSLKSFSADEKAAATAAFMTWIERLGSLQTAKNKIARLEEQVDALLEPVA